MRVPFIEPGVMGEHTIRGLKEGHVMLLQRARESTE